MYTWFSFRIFHFHYYYYYIQKQIHNKTENKMNIKVLSGLCRTDKRLFSIHTFSHSVRCWLRRVSEWVSPCVCVCVSEGIFIIIFIWKVHFTRWTTLKFPVTSRTYKHPLQNNKNRTREWQSATANEEIKLVRFAGPGGWLHVMYSPRKKLMYRNKY